MYSNQSTKNHSVRQLQILRIKNHYTNSINLIELGLGLGLRNRRFDSNLLFLESLDTNKPGK